MNTDESVSLPYVRRCWCLDAPHGRDVSQLPASLRGRRVVVFVHGFGQGFHQIVNASRQLRQHLQAAGGCGRGASTAVLAFAWPSHKGKASYARARGDADLAAKRFATVLSVLAALGCSVTVVAHSLGCRVALSALL